MYPEYIINYMKEEVVSAGFQEIVDPQEIHQIIKNHKSILIFINSVCGCVGIKTRSSLINAIENLKIIPEKLVTVFDGIDIEAAKAVKSYANDDFSSSPSLILLVNSKIVSIMDRSFFEKNNEEIISKNISETIKKFCK
ncbi:MAG: BrxA/BrxB family bacilliredoxin [Bacteroides sp.]|nr:MAG: BrxA/BrxB family bacilliredoxin [Bacteroides sp.]